MRTTHRGFVRISQKIILSFLQFPNGEILQARIDEWGNLELCISDADMPEIREGEPTSTVMPIYTRYEDPQGHWVAIRSPLNTPNTP